MTHIAWQANTRGYRVVMVNDAGIQEEYCAGNSPHDSSVYVEPGSVGSLSLRTLRKYAKQTAEEMATEHDIDRQAIWEHPDLLDD